MHSEVDRRQFLRRSGAVLGGAALAGGAWGLTGAVGSSEDDRRNIVLVVIDTLRPDHLGCYGGSARTPNIDALARESVRFDRVFPEAMPTVPARRSILTGRRTYPFDGWQPWAGLAKRAGWAPITPGAETLMTILRRHGYWTTYVSDNPFLTHTHAFAPLRDSVDRYVSVRAQRGVRRSAPDVPRKEALRRLPPAMRTEASIRGIRRYLANNGRAEHESEQGAARVFGAAARLLPDAARRRPFVMVVDSFDPHEPWTPPRKYLDLYGDPDYRGAEIADVLYRRSDYLSDEQLRRLRATYAACVTMVDHWAGHFLSELHDRGLAEDTVVALVSDHGIFLGEHGRTGKSDSYLHPELIHVPLLLRDPAGRGAGAASDYFATTVDLAPTLMAMAGLEPPEHFEGTDLSPILQGGEPAAARAFAYGGYSNFSFLRDERWAFVARNDNGWRMLYDLRQDPGERRDLAARRPEVAKRMWRRLLGELGRRPPRYSQQQVHARPRELRYRGG